MYDTVLQIMGMSATIKLFTRFSQMEIKVHNNSEIFHEPNCAAHVSIKGLNALKIGSLSGSIAAELPLWYPF